MEEKKSIFKDEAPKKIAIASVFGAQPKQDPFPIKKAASENPKPNPWGKKEEPVEAPKANPWAKKEEPVKEVIQEAPKNEVIASSNTKPDNSNKEPPKKLVTPSVFGAQPKTEARPSIKEPPKKLDIKAAEPI